MRRVLVVVLLVLAVSPLTAPCSVGSPLDLFGGAAEHAQTGKSPVDPLVPTLPAVSLAVVTAGLPAAAVVALGAPAVPAPVRTLHLRL